jgi:hypothetical protein
MAPRPRGGIGQLFLLEAGEIAAGQMQQIARQFDNLRAFGIQRFMDQIIVIAVTARSYRRITRSGYQPLWRIKRPRK